MDGALPHWAMSAPGNLTARSARTVEASAMRRKGNGSLVPFGMLELPSNVACQLWASVSIQMRIFRPR